MTVHEATARRVRTALFLGLALVGATAARAQWALETVEHGTGVSGDASLKVSPSGQPVVAFAGATLELARWDGANWNAELVTDATCGISNPSLAIDAGGNPTIAYQDRDTGDLRYASWNGSAWSTARVAHVGDWATWRGADSLALDAAGDPSISYYDAVSGELKLARWDGATWRIEVVDVSGGFVLPSLALDGTGNPLIAYVDGARGLILARWNGAAWTREVVDGDPASQSASLALDSAGNAVIGYSGHSAQWRGQLRLARWNGVSWAIDALDNAAFNFVDVTGLAVDSQDHPLVVYVGETSADPYDHLEAATWNGSAWTVNGIIEMSGVSATSMALDATGMPVTAFSASLNHGAGLPLGSAMWRGGSWAFDAFGGETVERPRGTTSLALDASGRPRLAWSMSGTASQLRYAAFDGSAWTRETVASPCANPAHLWAPVSLALDATGAPRIGFGGDALRYARFDGVGWALETVDPVPTYEVVLTLDAAGDPALAYYTGGDELKYARFDGTTWAVETVETCDWSLVPESGISVALDGSGNPSIVYPLGRASVPNALRHAHRDGSGWTIETVADIQADFAWSSLAFDGASNPILAYTDGLAVRLARRNGAAWTIETVAGVYLIGAVSLALDPAGNPALCYRPEGIGGDLTYARWDGTLWTTQAVQATDGDDRNCSIRIDSAGTPWIAYANATACNDGVRLAHLVPRASVLYRGVVADTAPGWQAASLPLTAANDDETPPFPLATAERGSADDGLPSIAPLTLYRALLDGTNEAGNVLVAVKRPGRVHLHY